MILETIARTFLPNPKLPIAEANVSRILVYADMGLGNFLLLVPTIRALRKRYPKAEIHLLAGSSGIVELASCSDFFDQTYLVPASRSGKLNLLFRLFVMRGDVVRWGVKPSFDLLVSTFLGNSKFCRAATLVTRPKYRLGHVSGGDWSSKWDYFYNLPVPTQADTHEVDRCIALVKHLGCESVDREVRLTLAESERQSAKELLDRLGVGEEQKLLCVQAGSAPGQWWKRWSSEKFASVCDRLVRESGYAVLFVGAPNEREVVSDIQSAMNEESFSAVGETTVLQLAAIVERAEVVLGNDSGVSHIAAALEVRTVTIFGPTDPNRSAPLNSKLKIVRKEDVPCSPCYRMNELGTAKSANNCDHFSCLEGISVDDVFIAVVGA